LSNTYTIKEETLISTADALRRYLLPNYTETIIDPNLWVEDCLAVQSKLKIVKGINYRADFIVAWEEWDADGTQKDPVEGQYSADQKDIWAWGYAMNNRGQTVPVLVCDWCDLYFYEGTTELFDELCEKWRKIEDRSTGYLWDSPCHSYIYTTPIVVDNANPVAEKYGPTEFPDKIAEVYQAGQSASGIKNINEAEF
jgi:hypothetical protein